MSNKHIDSICDNMLAQISKHGKNWLKMWVGLGMPRRLCGEYYQGVNVFNLWATKDKHKFKSDTWGTFNQIRDAGGSVLAGQKSPTVSVFWMINDYKTGKKTRDGDDETKTSRYLRFSPIFNLDQTTLKDNETYNHNLHTQMKMGSAHYIPEVEDYVKATGADIRYDDDLGLGRCYYVPSQDYIGMVNRECFVKTDVSATENYYSVLLHELTHWTSPEKRTDRDGYKKGKYFENFEPKEMYAFEELVAELGSAIQSGLLGISMEPAKHSAIYLTLWADRIKKDRDFLMKSATCAKNAVLFIDSLQKEPKFKSYKKLAVEKKKDIAA